MEIAENLPAPKRGDLIYSGKGTRKERTWIIIRSVLKKRAKNRSFGIFRARWWELEPDMRIRLYRSAQRNGGQVTWWTWPLSKPKKKQSVNFGL